MGLCVEFFMLIFTVFFVDFLIERSQRIKWREVRQLAKDDLFVLSNGLVTSFANPLGFGVSGFMTESPNVEVVGANIVAWYLRKITLETPLKGLGRMSTADWKNLHTNLQLTRLELREKIGLYKEALSPEILGKLLTVNRTFTAFLDTFMLVPEYFIDPPSRWPANSGGAARNNQNRQLFLEEMAAELETCIVAVEALRIGLDRFRM